MADPVSLTAISLGMTAASSAVGAAGSIFQGQANAAMYNYKAQVDQQNAAIASQMAGLTEAEGQTRMAVRGMQLGAQRSALGAQQGASGLATDMGTQKSVMRSAQEMDRIDLTMMQYDTNKKTYGYMVQNAQALSQAGADRAAASNASTAGYIGAASAVLGGGASFANKWLMAGQTGALNSDQLTATVVS